MVRKTVVLIAVLLLAGLVGAQQAEKTLVLQGGQTLEVRDARLAGGMVYVTLPTGEMRAYAVSDVDLEASGLAPKAPQGDAHEAAAPPSLVDLAKKDRGATRVTITDADVAHVQRLEPGAGAEGKPKTTEMAGSTLSVAVSGYERKGRELTVKGRVANQGKLPVSGIRLEAQVKNGAGKVVGRAQKAIDGTLEGGKTKEFAMTFQLPEGEIAGVDVRIVGAVAPVEMKRPAPQGSAGEE